MQASTTIREQSGAKWTATQTNQPNARAYWVSLDSGKSMAKPNVLGFYASSINDAANALNNI
jgi:hypothetical protein